MTKEEFAEEILSGRYGHPPQIFVDRAILNLGSILETLTVADIRSDRDIPFHSIMDLTAREVTLADQEKIPLEDFAKFAPSDLTLYLRNR